MVNNSLGSQRMDFMHGPEQGRGRLVASMHPSAARLALVIHHQQGNSVVCRQSMGCSSVLCGT